MLHVNSTHYVYVVCIIFRQNTLSKHFENVVICSVDIHVQKEQKIILCLQSLQKYRNLHTFSYMYNAMGIYNFQ